MNMRILLIEENREAARLLGRRLFNHGFEVTTTPSSLHGIDLIQRNDPEAILLDLKILELDGWKICDEIRLISEALIIIFSDFIEPDTINSVLDAGPNHFLLKSIPLNELASYIKKNKFSFAESY